MIASVASVANTQVREPRQHRLLPQLIQQHLHSLDKEIKKHGTAQDYDGITIPSYMRYTSRLTQNS